MKQPIAICLPSIRPDRLSEWYAAWKPILQKHNPRIFITRDGERPICSELLPGRSIDMDTPLPVQDLIYNFTDACRNLSFYHAIREGAEVVISMDDDVLPDRRGGDAIAQHLEALSQKVSVTWLNTANEMYVRGVPYGTRQEARVVLSHGV